MRRMTQLTRTLSLALPLALLAGHAQANDFDLVAGAQSDFRAIAEDLSAGIAYKSIQPSTPQGLIGFDVGVLATYTSVENKDSWQRLTGERLDQIGHVGLTASKGLPLNFDVAAFVSVIPGTDARLYGAEARYAIWDGNIALPAIALRLGYTELTGEDDIEADTLNYDISVSKTFPVVTPYIGYGRVDSTVTPTGGVSQAFGEEDFDLDRTYIGARLSLAVLSIGLEAEQTGDNTGFNLRLALGL